MRSLYSGEERMIDQFLFENFDGFVSKIKKGFKVQRGNCFLRVLSKRRFFELITRQRVISLRRFGRIFLNRLDE